jgi:O-antigen ligase
VTRAPSDGGDTLAGASPRLTAAVVALSALATVLVTAEVLRRPTQTVALIALFGCLTVIVLLRRRLVRLRLPQVFSGLVFALPLAAICGPALSVAGYRQLFAFRLLLATVVVLGLVLLALGRRPRYLGPRNLVLLLAAWFAWLAITTAWAPDKHVALRYLGVVLIELVLVAAVAMAGDSRRRLRWTMAALAVGYGLAVTVGALEVLTGRHLSSSVAAFGGKQHIATGFFYNPNDLATFIAMSWPFLLLGLLMTRRRALVGLDLLFMAIGLFALVRTGSRSSLLAIGLTTVLVAVVLVARRWTRRRGLVVALTVALIAGAAFLTLNTSDSPLLSRFRVATDTSEVQTTQSSGETRLALTRAGLNAGAATLFFGVGPGNAEGLVKRQPGAPLEVTSLHDWWLEVFVDGGWPALLLYSALYVGMIVVTWRVSRLAGDPFLRYLAAAVAIALIGFVIGSLGPSTVVGFAPMWILFGLALAAARRAHFEQTENEPS